MGKFRRRLLMLWAASSEGEEGLPDGYSPIEYVSTNIKNLEYFDTGITGGNTLKVEIKIKFNDYSSYNTFVAFGTRVDNKTFSMYCQTVNPRINAKYGSTAIVNVFDAFDINTVYTLIKDGPDNYVNGEKVKSNPEVAAFTTSNILLSAENSTNNKNITGAHIYYCKMWKGGELVRSFLPVSNETTEALYDEVTKALFQKQTGPRTLDINSEREGGV